MAAGALVALAGLALIALGRGVLRGQRRAWRVAVVLLAGTILLHLVAGADIEESLIAGAVLAFLMINRKEFQAASDATSLRSALITLAGVAVGVAVVATVSLELFTHIRHHPNEVLPWWTTFWAVSERFVGITTIDLPERPDRFITPALLAIGLSLAAITLFLLTRPVVDRRLGSGRAAEFRARDIVRRHGSVSYTHLTPTSAPPPRWWPSTGPPACPRNTPPMGRPPKGHVWRAASARVRAALRPAGPAPITRASVLRSI